MLWIQVFLIHLSLFHYLWEHSCYYQTFQLKTHLLHLFCQITHSTHFVFCLNGPDKSSTSGCLWWRPPLRLSLSNKVIWVRQTHSNLWTANQKHHRDFLCSSRCQDGGNNRRWRTGGLSQINRERNKDKWKNTTVGSQTALILDYTE